MKSGSGGTWLRLVGLCGLTLASGCVSSFRAGDPDRAASASQIAPAIEWPARDLPVGSVDPGAGSVLRPPREPAPTRCELVRVVPVGMGSVRQLHCDPGDPQRLWAQDQDGDTYRFVTMCERIELRTSEESRLLGPLLASRSGAWTADRSDLMDGSRIAVSLPDKPPRAIVLFLPGLAGARPKALMDWARRSAMAFIEVKSSAMDTPRGPLHIGSTADLPAAADALAADVDQRLAETAYAAEGALEFFQAEHPQLRGLPVVLVGASAGALAAPAVTIRLDKPVAAVVMIGGGCDIYMISQRTNLSKTLLPIQWGPRTSYLDEARLDSLYRERTRLDPLVLASQLVRVPVLNIFATMDDFVPTPAARELQERLGHPDSVTFTTGHIGMFLALSGDDHTVPEWIDKHLPPSESRDGH